MADDDLQKTKINELFKMQRVACLGDTFAQGISQLLDLFTTFAFNSSLYYVAHAILLPLLLDCRLRKHHIKNVGFVE